MYVKRKFALMVSLLLIVSLLGACGGGNTPANATTTSAIASQAADTQEQNGVQETTTQAAAASAAPTEISFFHWKGEEKTVWDALIPKFEEENPDVRINMEILPEGSYYPTLKARVLSGQGLDVFEVNPGSQFQSFIESDPFYDLNGQPFIAEMNPVFLGPGQLDGKQLIIPMSKSFVGLFYNKSIFDELGLSAPQTWDEFMNVCETIKTNDKGLAPNGVISTGLAEAYTSLWPWIGFLAQYSTDLDIYPKLADGRANFTDPLFKEVLTPISIMAEKGYWIPNANGTKYDASLTLFASERTAMLNTGTWAIGAIREINPDLDFSIFIVPSPGGELVAGVAPAQAICVFNKSVHMDASLKWVNYIFSKDAMEDYGNGTGQEVPNVNAVLNNDDLNAMAPIGNSGQLYALYNSPNNQIDQDLVSEISSRAIMGEPIDTILADAQKKLETLW
ncbi:MAG: extracellular solute-binding protein [Oscillospiraceae bacterium]|nr:extracellular solute-binding protein [Oscillospiraceae bacterium]